MEAGTLHATGLSSGGTGARLARAVIIVAGACALVACLTTLVCVAAVECATLYDR